MKIAVPHHMTAEQARIRVEQKLAQLLTQFGARAEDLSQEWAGNTLQFKGKARGFSLEGTVEVTDAEVVIDANLPLMAKPFEGRIRQAVEREADAMFRTA